MAWSCHYATGCFVAFLGEFSLLKSGWNMKKIFCCPALELFHSLPLWKTVLFVSSRAFSLSTPVENSEATWKKATKCNKPICYVLFQIFPNFNRIDNFFYFEAYSSVFTNSHYYLQTCTYFDKYYKKLWMAVQFIFLGLS